MDVTPEIIFIEGKMQFFVATQGIFLLQRAAPSRDLPVATLDINFLWLHWVYDCMQRTATPRGHHSSSGNKRYKLFVALDIDNLIFGIIVAFLGPLISLFRNCQNPAP